MHCPNCGTGISLDQKFCRSCGLGLEKIAQAVSEQLPTKLDENLLDRKDRLERLGVSALGIFGLGVLGFFLYMVGYKLMLSKGMLMAGLGVLASIIILGSGILSVILFAKAKEVEEAAAKRRLRQPEEMLETGTSVKLLPEDQREPMPSVTERTTELLFVKKKGRPKEG